MTVKLADLNQRFPSLGSRLAQEIPGLTPSSPISIENVTALQTRRANDEQHFRAVEAEQRTLRNDAVGVALFSALALGTLGYAAYALALV